MNGPVRCHLLIGPPASGKTTLAQKLAPLLTKPGEQPALVLSTDRIRAEVFGDASVQGPWFDIREQLLKELRQAVRAGQPVILDATHARRPWRLAFTQSLELPAPVEWIGWWLQTPTAQCLAWNQTRQRKVPEPVIQEMAAALSHKTFGPARAEVCGGCRARSQQRFRRCVISAKPAGCSRQTHPQRREQGAGKERR